MVEQFETMLQLAAREVFDTMLNIKVNFVPPETKIANHPYVAGTVGFTGKFSGLLHLYTNIGFARKMTSHLLGIPPDQIEGHEMINDVIGELTNMHAGHIKSRLSDRGMPCSITIPTVVHGNDFSFQTISGSSKMTLCVCSTPQEAVLLEMIVKPQ
jgi:chemotaxis protein CheX